MVYNWLNWSFWSRCAVCHFVLCHQVKVALLPLQPNQYQENLEYFLPFVPGLLIIGSMEIRECNTQPQKIERSKLQLYSGKKIALMIRRPIFYLIEGRCPSRHKNGGFAFSASTLMERFLEGSAPLRLWYVNSEEKIFICYSSHLG